MTLSPPLPRRRLKMSATVRIACFLLLVASIASFDAAPLHAQRWPLESGYTYLSLGINGFRGNGYFGRTGGEVSVTRLEESTLRFYSEYGYSRYVTGTVNVPAYRTLTVQESADSPLHRVESPGDIELGLRIGIYPGENDAILLSGIFGIPLGETTNDEGLWSGDDEYDQAVLIGYGREFPSLAMRVSVQGGYHFRNDGFSDELLLNGCAELRPLNVLQLLLHVRYLQSQENGNPEFTGGRYGFGSNDRRFLMYGPELALWITRGFGLRASVFATTEARNMPSAALISAGLFLLVAPSRTH